MTGPVTSHFLLGYHEIEINAAPILKMRQLRLGKRGPEATQLGNVESEIQTQIQEISATSFIYSFDTF